MRKVPYINYNELSGLYTFQQVADMLGLGVRELVEKGKKYNIRVRRDNAGCYLFDSKGVKMLHYRLYHESRGRRCV